MDTNHHSLVIVADTRMSGTCVVRARVCMGEYVSVSLSVFVSTCLRGTDRLREREGRWREIEGGERQEGAGWWVERKTENRTADAVT